MKTTSLSLLALVLAPLLAQAGSDSAPVRLCRNHVQAKIDVIDAGLHKGHNANQAQDLLKRRDKLRGQYKSCDSNPDAYKKDI